MVAPDWLARCRIFFTVVGDRQNERNGFLVCGIFFVLRDDAMLDGLNVANAIVWRVYWWSLFIFVF